MFIKIVFTSHPKMNFKLEDTGAIVSSHFLKLYYLICRFYLIFFLIRFFPVSPANSGRWVEPEFARVDMMFPCSGHGPARLLTVIYFSLPVARSLPRRGCVE